MLAWVVHREVFLTALAAHIGARGGIRMIDGDLWELGTGTEGGTPLTCFYHPAARCRTSPRPRLTAHRRALVLYGPQPAVATGPGRWLPLVELFGPDGVLAVRDLGALLRTGGTVRFVRDTGALWVGGALAREVPPGSREFAFIDHLAANLDRYVPYRDLKAAVLRQTGGDGGPEEATFCQKLKSRIKAKHVPGIDRLVVTTNKGDGYRLRGAGEV